MISDRTSFKTIRQIPAFHNFNESECHQLAEVANERSFAPGEKVIEQGKRSQNLWIVLEGHCEVVRECEHDGAVVLAELDALSVFGEMSFFSPAPHSANVVAKTPVKLLSISRRDYDDMISDGVTAAYKLAYNVVEELAAKLRHMDEWITELSANHSGPPTMDAKPERVPEWRQFRNKLFNGWNL